MFEHGGKDRRILNARYDLSHKMSPYFERGRRFLIRFLYLQTMTAKSNQLNLFDLSMIVVSLVIGMGIFRNPASVAATTGNSSIFF